MQLSTDHSFHFELLRTLGVAPYHGSDVGEVLAAASRITPGDFESFSSVFFDLATRVYSQAEKIDSAKYKVSARDAYFRAATYYRAADFYIHGKAGEEDVRRRMDELWTSQARAFDRAIALLPIPGERITLQAEGFQVPAIFYRSHVEGASGPRPTVLMCNGYDGSQEEMLHSCGFAALERGYNVMTFEGPGQPTVRRNQGLGFITEWEKVVTPVVDWLASRPGEVDHSKLGLLGFSMGGFLAVRAAAFEHRLAAAIAIDGVYDVHQAFFNQLPPPWQAMLEAGQTDALEAQLRDILAAGKAPTSMRWGIEQGQWSFNAAKAVEFLERTKPMTLEGIADKVSCPVWVGNATEDQFFLGQPEMVKQALGERGTHGKLGAEDAAGYHCHVGAGVFMNQVVFDWFGDVVAKG